MSPVNQEIQGTMYSQACEIVMKTGCLPGSADISHHSTLDLALLPGPTRNIRHDIGKIMAWMDHGKNLVMILNASRGVLEQILTGSHMILKDSRKVLEDSCEVLDVLCKIWDVLYRCFMHGHPDLLYQCGPGKT